MKDMNMDLAVTRLREAIALHQKHMDGTAPTTERSQMAMMALMREALSAIKPSGGLIRHMGK